ncbi:DMT family transporter [Breoghania sp. L-A4]|nr:DMT family transporter [Breoghania sp. L-A4]
MMPVDFGLYALVLFSWGTSWLALKMQVGVVAPEVSVFWRFLFAATLMMTWAMVSRRRLRFAVGDHLRFAGLGGMIFSTNFVLFYYGALHLPSGLLSVVFSLTSIINLLLAAVIFRQGISRRVLIGGILGACGIALMFWPQIAGTRINHDALVGLGFCAAGTVSFCLGNMLSASNQARGLPVVSANAWGMVYGAAFLAVFARIKGDAFIMELTPAYIGGLVWLVVFSTVLAFACYLTLLGRIGSARAGYATVMFPIVALAISTVVEGYQWTPGALAGLLCVLAGNLFVLTRGRDVRQRPAGS